MGNEKIKVLIADDSALMRILISDILKEESDIEIISKVRDGKEAAEEVLKLRPDVVVLDLTMGDYDGIYAVKRIMKECPTPIIILSAMGNTDMAPILEALAEGAVDYLNKPVTFNSNKDEIKEQLTKKIKEVSNHNVKGNVSKKIIAANINPHSFGQKLNYDIIVIGSSTGGPGAVETVITNLPGNLTVPVIIVQHMPANFVPSFAARLDKLTPLTVKMGLKDDLVEAGKIILAPGSRNMIVKRDKNNKVVIDFTTEKFKEYNHPSVNGLMISAAKVFGKKCIGVILTGMGKDGTEGMKAIKQEGGYNIAQSKDSCVVYGMPKAAVEEGVVDQVVPLKEIGGFLVSCLS